MPRNKNLLIKLNKVLKKSKQIIISNKTLQVQGMHLIIEENIQLILTLAAIHKQYRNITTVTTEIKINFNQLIIQIKIQNKH